MEKILFALAAAIILVSGPTFAQDCTNLQRHIDGWIGQDGRTYSTDSIALSFAQTNHANNQPMIFGHQPWWQGIGHQGTNVFNRGNSTSSIYTGRLKTTQLSPSVWRDESYLTLNTSSRRVDIRYSWGTERATIRSCFTQPGAATIIASGSHGNFYMISIRPIPEIG